MRRYASPSISSITERTQRNLIKFDVYIKKLWRRGWGVGSISYCYTSRYTLAVQSTSAGMFVSVCLSAGMWQTTRQYNAISLICDNSVTTQTTVSQLKMYDF